MKPFKMFSFHFIREKKISLKNIIPYTISGNEWMLLKPQGTPLHKTTTTCYKLSKISEKQERKKYQVGRHGQQQNLITAPARQGCCWGCYEKAKVGKGGKHESPRPKFLMCSYRQLVQAIRLLPIKSTILNKCQMSCIINKSITYWKGKV